MVCSYNEYEKDRFCECSVTTFFDPSPAITEPPSKRQAMDSAGTAAAMVSPFADSADDSSTSLSSIAGGPSPSNVSTDQIPIDVLFEYTSGVVADPDSDDEVFAEIIFRGKSISGDGVVFVDKLPDDEIVDPRVKVETVSESASSPPRSRRKHLGSDDDMENYIPPLPYGAFKDWEIGGNMLCQSLHSDDVEDFWRTQDDWIVSSWKLYPKSSVHVLDLTNGKTVYMFVDKFFPIGQHCLNAMLRHRLTVPPSYCRDVVVAGNIIQMVQAGLRESYECVASAPFFCVSACTARQMVFNSPWLTPKKESGSPLQTALVCFSNPLIALASPEQTATGKDVSNPLYGCDGLPKTVRVFQFTLDSCSEKLDWFLLHQDWKLLFFDSAVSIDAADLDAASTVFAACIVSAEIFISADGIKSFLLIMFLLVMFSFLLTEIESAGHVLVSADRDRIC
ncbi:hypothetical protein Tco_1102235 [Tanacetum coccineum]